MNTMSKKLYHVFRVACAMCFIGHGAFGIITKQVWCNYFGVFGIDETRAYALMPVVGVTDIVLGLVLLFHPLKIAAAWLIFWGLFTALLRPLSGEPFAEFLERAGNYGAPFMLMILAGTQLSLRDWSQKLRAPDTQSMERWKIIIPSLQVIGFMLLIGHGWLNIIEKPALLKQYASLGFDAPEKIALFIGVSEIVGALSILIWPVRQVVFILFVWKVISETSYPAFPVFEWIERGGSYAMLLALWLVLKDKDIPTQALFLKTWFTTASGNSKSKPLLFCPDFLQ